jgi:hypothetical protein
LILHPFPQACYHERRLAGEAARDRSFVLFILIVSTHGLRLPATSRIV